MNRASDLLLRHATAILFVVVFVYFGLSADNFFTVENILNIVKQASFVGILAVGMTFVLLTAGIDLSVGSNMYVTAMTVGYLLQDSRPARAVRRFRRPRRRAGDRGGVRSDQRLLHRLSFASRRFWSRLRRWSPATASCTAITESFGIDYPTAFLAFGAATVLGIPIPVIVFALVVAAAHVVLDPHRLRPAALCGRQRHRGGTEGGDQYRDVSCSRCMSFRGSAPPSAACC